MGQKYSSNSTSGYNSTPPSDDGTVSEANKVKWSTIKTKLSDPVKDRGDTIDSELATHFDNGPTAITIETTLGASHYNQVIEASGSSDVTLSDASSLTAGWFCDIINKGSNNFNLVRATAADTIDGTSADIVIYPLDTIRVIVNAGADGFLTKNRINKFNKGADLASATALPLIKDGNYFDVTGTTTITSLDSVGINAVVKLQFDGVLTLTHHATNLILPGAANITTAAGDEAEFFEYASGDWRCTNYSRADGTPVILSGIDTVQATTSGTAFDFTSIPSWAKAIHVTLKGVSLSGTDDLLVQIGDSGGIESSGYTSLSILYTPTGPTIVASQATAGFHTLTAGASGTTDGTFTLTLHDSSTNTWMCSATLGDYSGQRGVQTTGDKALSAGLDRIRLTRSGTDTFDAGSVNVTYF